ncbi:hypothetical protein [Burkholderia sp. Ac-20365]|uniref:DUF7716 domain-containing protein n=1 Tax=Burkholderia sp. Ac-20365 TaxID=2703897 RepID=UPI00197BB9EE|nr:hypothetical protein [Burkholderia sp. Ac-20365]
MDHLFTIRQIFLNPQQHSGWLYLPDPPWDMNTQGVFADDDKDADPDADPRPEIAKTNDWQEVLDVASIEDIVSNAQAQIENPRIEQLFEAFVYYFENDAFIAF